MIDIQIIKIEGDVLRFPVTIDDVTEVDKVALNEKNQNWVVSVMSEYPFKSKENSDNTYQVVAGQEGSGEQEKY